MALFKPFHGDSSRISTSITPFHEGYVYLTTDDVKLYADVVVGGQNQRLCLNEGGGSTVNSVSVTLAANGWSNGTQTVNVTGIKATSSGNAGIPSSATVAQYNAAAAAQIIPSGQANGTVTFKALKAVPTIDIPVLVVFYD